MHGAAIKIILILVSARKSIHSRAIFPAEILSKNKNYSFRALDSARFE
jgi:hypothetical protein